MLTTQQKSYVSCLSRFCTRNFPEKNVTTDRFYYDENGTTVLGKLSLKEQLCCSRFSFFYFEMSHLCHVISVQVIQERIVIREIVISSLFLIFIFYLFFWGERESFFHCYEINVSYSK